MLHAAIEKILVMVLQIHQRDLPQRIQLENNIAQHHKNKYKEKRHREIQQIRHLLLMAELAEHQNIGRELRQNQLKSQIYHMRAIYMLFLKMQVKVLIVQKMLLLVFVQDVELVMVVAVKLLVAYQEPIG